MSYVSIHFHQSTGQYVPEALYGDWLDTEFYNLGTPENSHPGDCGLLWVIKGSEDFP